MPTPTTRPNYLWDTALLRAHSNAFLSILSLLLLVQLCHNTAYSTTFQEIPHLLFGRAAVLPIDLILGDSSTSAPQTQLDYSKKSVENLQLAHELARRNLREQTDK